MRKKTTPDDEKNIKTFRPLRIFYSILGWIMIVLGIIGVALPVMPTVPFLLIASWCFARSSPRFHHWLHNHRIFGPPLKRWEENRVIPLFVKILTVVSMASGFLLFVVFAHPALWLCVLVAIVLFAVAIYIMTRPSSPKSSSLSLSE
ncbi:YbaN family protein [Bartonella sp. F02]|uniref:YbaN family protein n=1 Tax=Bartonella sp. F02 TaxID=2967262 RepID=UPI0022A9D202|nr:YbaN family protein [Bartonella sp. F02]MCZ2328007.1 YbaN family protein [Bartonella sp. F02]